MAAPGEVRMNAAIAAVLSEQDNISSLQEDCNSTQVLSWRKRCFSLVSQPASIKIGWSQPLIDSSHPVNQKYFFESAFSDGFVKKAPSNKQTILHSRLIKPCCYLFILTKDYHIFFFKCNNFETSVKMTEDAPLDAFTELFVQIQQDRWWAQMSSLLCYFLDISYYCLMFNKAYLIMCL